LLSCGAPSVACSTVATRPGRIAAVGGTLSITDAFRGERRALRGGLPFRGVIGGGGWKR
jgi:hypothetical protein